MLRSDNRTTESYCFKKLNLVHSCPIGQHITVKSEAFPLHHRDADKTLDITKQAAQTSSGQREEPPSAFGGSHAQDPLYSKHPGTAALRELGDTQ